MKLVPKTWKKTFSGATDVAMVPRDDSRVTLQIFNEDGANGIRICGDATQDGVLLKASGIETLEAEFNGDKVATVPLVIKPDAGTPTVSVLEICQESEG